MESVKQAAALAAESGAVLHLVGAYRDLTWGERERARRAMPPELRVDHVANPLAEIGDILEDTAYALRDYQPRLYLHTLKADPAVALTELAARKAADLIVVGNRGAAGPLRLLRPAICDQVRKRARCEVLVADTTEFWDTAA